MHYHPFPLFSRCGKKIGRDQPLKFQQGEIVRNITYVGYAHFVQQYRRSKEVSAKDHTCSDVFLLMSPLHDRRNKNDKAVILFHHDCMGERRMCSVQHLLGMFPDPRKWRYLRTIAASELEKTNYEQLNYGSSSSLKRTNEVAFEARIRQSRSECEAQLFLVQHSCGLSFTVSLRFSCFLLDH